MIVDSSVIVAIFLQEPGYESLVQRLAESGYTAVSAANSVEASIVLSARLGQDIRPLLTRFFQQTNISVVPVTETHWGVAVGAWLRFGKGRHAAALNFGDCLAYATAKVARAPLMCVGDDFPLTDLELA